MASDTMDDKFLSVPKRALILSLLLHVFVPVFFVTSELFHFSDFRIKEKKLGEEIYQTYVQVDVVALPEKVGIRDEFVDSTLPILKNPQSMAPPIEETKSAEPEASKDVMTLPDEAEAARKAEEEKKKAEEERKKAEAEKKKQELAEKKKKEAEEKAKRDAEQKKREQEAQKAMEELKRRMEQERALKELAKGKEGREELKGNVLSKGTATRGNVGAEQERYVALVEAAIRENFNVFEWLKTKSLEAHVQIRISVVGQIMSRELVKSSGNTRYDSAVLQAIDDTRKLPPPPEGSQIAEEGAVIIFKP